MASTTATPCEAEEAGGFAAAGAPVPVLPVPPVPAFGSVPGLGGVVRPSAPGFGSALGLFGSEA
ncbi:hypothetical protein D7W79_23100 [Corallococcus exercitus]|nr:hypothetical protein D7W79_23100 [Corallococcus exercitus]